MVRSKAKTAYSTNVLALMRAEPADEREDVVWKKAISKLLSDDVEGYNGGAFKWPWMSGGGKGSSEIVLENTRKTRKKGKKNDPKFKKLADTEMRAKERLAKAGQIFKAQTVRVGRRAKNKSGKKATTEDDDQAVSSDDLKHDKVLKPQTVHVERKAKNKTAKKATKDKGELAPVEAPRTKEKAPVQEATTELVVVPAVEEGLTFVQKEVIHDARDLLSLVETENAEVTLALEVLAHWRMTRT
ncbi:hypothetical protein B0H11DRAFT_1939750 [Mycena galericulata]|nr:hypothetical protein B0H11DRAFT_1939750 [Mycena galericulata]